MIFSPTVQPPSIPSLATFDKTAPRFDINCSLCHYIPWGLVPLVLASAGGTEESRYAHLIRSLIPSVLIRLPCALRIRKHLVYCTTILTARSTERLARLERSITNQIQNHFDERRKRWRGSVTICLSKLCDIRSPTKADMQLSDVLDVFTALPQSGQVNSSLTSPPTTSTNSGKPMIKINEEHTTKKHEPAPQEMMYRSIRATPSASHIWRDLSEDPKSWEVAKAVMEGSGEKG